MQTNHLSLIKWIWQVYDWNILVICLYQPQQHSWGLAWPGSSRRSLQLHPCTETSCTHTSFIEKLSRGRQSASRKWRPPRHAWCSHARSHAVCVSDNDVYLFDCKTTQLGYSLVLLVTPLGSKLTPSLNALSKTLFSIRGDGVVSESCVAAPLLSRV